MFGWIIYEQNEMLQGIGSIFDCARSASIGMLRILYQKYPKFEDDQVFYASERAILITEGVLLNSVDLISSSSASSLSEALVGLFSKNVRQCITSLNGPYCGAYCNDKTTTIFTNRIGDRPVYYYHANGIRIASSNLNVLIEFCRQNGLVLTFDTDAGDVMLELGYMVNNSTMVNEIKRLFPGELLIWDRHRQHTEQYYMYDNTEDSTITLEDAIDNVDRLFRQAVKRCFDKDLEYGYKHIAGLSGGLDSRMTTWVARDMGYGPFVNLNWGMSGCEDYRIAARIAAHLGNDFLFSSLDNMNCFYDIDDAVWRIYGAALYMRSTGALFLAKSLDTSQYGMMHTGQIGDVIIGSFTNTYTHKPPTAQGVITNPKAFTHLVHCEKYHNLEQMKFYIRGFLGVSASSQLQNEFWPLASPFLDNDLMEFALKVPLKYRVGHYLYVRWINAKYPEAMEFQRNDSLFGVKTTYMYPRFSTFVNKAYREIRRDTQIVKNKLGISKYRFRLDGMNPINAVYERDPRLSSFMQQYFDMNIGLFDNAPTYQGILRQRFAFGDAQGRAKVLMVLSFCKQHDLFAEKT